MTERAGEFWRGYERFPDQEVLLSLAVRKAMEAHPKQRLGQILDNVLKGDDLFQIYDEELSRRLFQYAGLVEEGPWVQ